MFLEKCGKIFFLKMRPAFFFSLVALPLFLTALFLFQEKVHLRELEERFIKASRKEKLAMERKGRKDRFLRRYSEANPYFLDQMIESFPLLQNEKLRLESLQSHPAFPESLSIRDRIQFLSENKLIFREEKIENSKEMKEVYEHQLYPAQMDEDDLKQILSIIEDVPIDTYLPKEHPPQILVKDFRLKKIQTPLNTEVFEVEMDLIKREFIK